MSALPQICTFASCYILGGLRGHVFRILNVSITSCLHLRSSTGYRFGSFRLVYDLSLSLNCSIGYWLNTLEASHALFRGWPSACMQYFKFGLIVALCEEINTSCFLQHIADCNLKSSALSFRVANMHCSPHLQAMVMTVPRS